MGRNICIFADGTGQGGSIQRKDNTNVWRLYCATEKVAPKDRQVCHYDSGLGAKSGEGWSRWIYDKLSQATGLGISKNIKECYDFLLKEYHGSDDRIFLFGFSRGAYTVRSLGGVLKLCGVPIDWRDAKGEAAQKEARTQLVEEAVEKVYKHYGATDAARQERADRGTVFARTHRAIPAAPHFIGVWDTVRSLGIPGSSGLVLWRHAFHDATLDARVTYARQALAIDENRQSFQPEIWAANPADIESGRIKQHWFCGVHSDIGGGYEDDTRLAEIALRWIVDEATVGIRDEQARLLVDEAQLPILTADHAVAPQHDERHGISLWREGTREALHESLWRERAALADPAVLVRLRAAGVPYPGGRTGPYRPVALKGRFLPDWTFPPET